MVVTLRYSAGNENYAGIFDLPLLPYLFYHRDKTF